MALLCPDHDIGLVAGSAQIMTSDSLHDEEAGVRASSLRTYII